MKLWNYTLTDPISPKLLMKAALIRAYALIKGMDFISAYNAYYIFTKAGYDFNPLATRNSFSEAQHAIDFALEREGKL